MNFLAHAYLSFNDPQILVGNMISDFVKGRDKLGFNGKIQNGIALHREIDQFTDAHPATAKAKTIFRPAYRLYSGPIVDVLYDHFLATDPIVFDEGSLKEFCASVYRMLEENAAQLPNHFLRVFTYMKTDNWLFYYRTTEGIRRSLGGLARRASYMSESSTAYGLFLDQYDLLNEYYHEFFPDVKRFAKERFEDLVGFS